MNHITAALDLIAQNQIAAFLCVAVVVFIASIALMVAYERADNKAALQQARAENQEAKAIDKGRKLFEQATRNRED
jgi:uncharacterized membrane protein